RAEAYLAAGHYYWNSGMFCFTARDLLKAAAQTCPDVLSAAEACFASRTSAPDRVEYAAQAFLAQPDISIDYAVMERARNCAMVPAGFDWSDIGSWKAISELDEADESGNRVRGSAIVIDSRNCFVQSEGRLVAVVGVNDLVVVDTGDAVLVA